MSSIQQAVKRGAEWLDEHLPGWEKRINLQKYSTRVQYLYQRR